MHVETRYGPSLPEFQNILVMDLGQMGDVILSLPALEAIRVRFPDARITILHGKPVDDIVRLAEVANEQIAVDRVELRDGNKLTSVGRIGRLITQVRRKKFDLVIDLHSLSESNLLGFVSGARYRLYGNRRSRSLDRLGRFPVRPPEEDRSKHLTDRYFDVLKPLGIERTVNAYHLPIPRAEVEKVEVRIKAAGVAGRHLVGFAVGAGHPSRCWDLDNFAELARRVVERGDSSVIVFLGPEERDLAAKLRKKFPVETVVIDDLSIVELLAAMSMLDVLVCNDSGPAHIAGIAGAPVVLIIDERAPLTYLPLSDSLRIVNPATIGDITVDAVAQAVTSALDR